MPNENIALRNDYGSWIDYNQWREMKVLERTVENMPKQVIEYYQKRLDMDIALDNLKEYVLASLKRKTKR